VILLDDLAAAEGGVEDEDLEAVIADGAAPPERRIAAGIALSAGAPDRARARIRVATNARADEHLRVALDKAAEGEVDVEYLERVAGGR
jgi:hypothetical protein